MAYKGQGQPDSSALNFARRLRDMACTSSRRNDSIRHILRVRRRDCVPSVELRRRLRFTNTIYRHCSCKEGSLVGHAAKRPAGELIKGLLLPTPPHTWRRRAGGQLKTWATAISGPRVFGHAQWGKDWVKVSSEVAQDRRTWKASVRDVVNSICDAGSTRPG